LKGRGEGLAQTIKKPGARYAAPDGERCRPVEKLTNGRETGSLEGMPDYGKSTNQNLFPRGNSWKERIQGEHEGKMMKREAEGRKF